MLQAAALAPVVEIGESEDVGTRARPHIVMVQAFAELTDIWRSGTHARIQCETMAHKISTKALTVLLTRGLSRTSGVRYRYKQLSI